MAVMVNETDHDAGMWERYNIINACETAARVVMGVRSRFGALLIFAFGLLLSLPLTALFLGADWLSTWNWTGIFTPQLEQGIEYASAGVGSATGAALAFRFVLQFLSIVPTIAELMAPYFAKWVPAFAGLFVIFSAFDYYTDWPTAESITAGMDFASWGTASEFGRWLTTVLLTLFFSLIVQYLAIIFIVITAVAAWVLVFGANKRGRR